LATKSSQKEPNKKPSKTKHKGPETNKNQTTRSRKGTKPGSLEVPLDKKMNGAEMPGIPVAQCCMKEWLEHKE
jgi:hypothetical protein